MFTDADAVAAVNAWRQYGQVSRFTPLTPAGATPELYLSATTPVLAAGLYRVSEVLFVVGSAAGTDLDARISVDGFFLNPLLTAATVAGGGFLLSGLPDQDWTAGAAAHTIEMFIAQSGGPGTVSALVGSIAWERKA
jgi:hypothetical protein